MKWAWVLLVVSCGLCSASVTNFDFAPVAVYWGKASASPPYSDAKVTMQAQWQGELNSGIYGAHFWKVSRDGYSQQGGITGTVFHHVPDPLWKMIEGKCSWTRARKYENGVLESEIQQRYSSFISWSGTGVSHHYNKVLIVDWNRRTMRWADNTDPLLAPIVDENGQVVWTPGDNRPVSGDWTGDQRSWFAELFIADDAHVTACKEAVDDLKAAGVFGWLGTKLTGASGETGSEGDMSGWQWTTPGYYDCGGSWHPGTSVPFLFSSTHTHGAVPGTSGYSPWVGNTKVQDWMGTIRTILRWFLWGGFVVCLVVWFKGRWTA